MLHCILDIAAGKHREAYEKAIKEMLAVTIRIVRLNYIGLPRSGKTSFWRRLIRKIKNILEAKEKEQPSTGVAESGEHVIIKSLSHKIGVILSKEWSVLKDLSEEGNMLIKLIHEAISSLTSEVSNLPDQQNVGESSETSSSINTSEVINESADAYEDDISKEFLSLINQASKNNGNTDLQKLLDDMILLINTDTGGQAEFLGLHASLVDGPSLNLLFHRLNDDLDKVFKTYYTDNNGTSTEKVDSTLTVEEVLFQALSSIACFSGCFLEDDDCQPSEEKSNSKVMFVGTHRDKVTDSEFNTKDQLLMEKIKCTEFFNKDIVMFASEEQLMLSADNLTGDEIEMSYIQKRLEEVIDNNFEKKQIPVTWLILSLYIRSKKWRTLSLTECEKLGGYLNIDPEELQHALWFYHHCIGVHLYYPDVLKDTLICDIQVVFDSATNLIKNTFSYKVSKRAYQDFKEKAQFSLEDLKKATSNYTAKSTSDYNGDLIPLEKLVRLLEHLGMLTVIPSACDEKTYFMPCVLQSARAEELVITPRSVSDPPSLMLRFNCGYVPMGLFPAMITNLVSQQCTSQQCTSQQCTSQQCTSQQCTSQQCTSQQCTPQQCTSQRCTSQQCMWDNWRLIQEGLRKNKVQFHVGKNYDKVSLLSHPQFLEIVISLFSAESLSSKESLCAYVRSVVERILNNVTKRLHHNYSMGYKFGFECPKHPGKDHLCVLEEETASVMVCLQNPKCEQPITLGLHHKVWFTKPKPCFINLPTPLPYLSGKKNRMTCT